MANRVDHRIQAKPNIRQSAQRIPSHGNLTIVKGIAQCCVGRNLIVQSCNPGRCLRITDVRSVAIVIGHEEDAVSGSESQLRYDLVGKPDSRREVSVLSVIQTAIFITIKYKLSWHVKTYR